jgi:hypothetical protein
MLSAYYTDNTVGSIELHCGPCISDISPLPFIKIILAQPGVVSHSVGALFCAKFAVEPNFSSSHGLRQWGVV